MLLLLLLPLLLLVGLCLLTHRDPSLYAVPPSANRWFARAGSSSLGLTMILGLLPVLK
jgi:hypothetical protein